MALPERLAILLASSGVGLLPAVAGACPYCAAGGSRPGALYFIIGAMVLLPYVVGWVVVRTIRRLDASAGDSRT